MTHADRIIAFLRENPEAWVSDDELSETLAIRPRQTVNQVARKLAQEGRILRRLVSGKTQNAIAAEGQAPPSPQYPRGRVSNVGTMTPAKFEELAGRIMSKHFGKTLTPGSARGVPKRFDLVSLDRTIVGDAKYFTMVRGERLPPAKFSVVAEYVWLLEHIQAERRFLVFGNDRRVPERWLQTYGHLATDVEFYYIDTEGNLYRLA